MSARLVSAMVEDLERRIVLLDALTASIEAELRRRPMQRLGECGERIRLMAALAQEVREGFEKEFS